MAETVIQPATPDLSPEEFSSSIASRRPVPGTTAREPISIPPPSDADLVKASAKYKPVMTPVEEQLNPDAERLGKVLGTPLESGIDPWTYLQYKARSSAEDQMRYLAGQFGPENVRLNELGKPVVRMRDEKGNVVDHTVDPFDINSQSVIGFLANTIPQTAAAALSLSGGRPKAIASAISKVPGLGWMAGKESTFLFKSALASGTAEAVGAIKDAGTQAYDRPTVNLTGILGEHLAQLPLDVAMDYGLTKGAGGVKWAYDLLSGKPVPNPMESAKRTAQALTSKLGGETDLSKTGKAAAEFFAQKGVLYKPTVGETTDIPLVAMTESYLGREAAGAAPIKARIEQSEQSNRAIQQYIVGSGTRDLDEEIGQRGIATFKEAFDAADSAIAAAQGAQTEALDQSIQKRLLDSFSLHSVPDRGFPWTETGDYLRGMGTKSRDVFWDTVEKQYDDLYAHPLAAERNVPTKNLMARVKELIREQPSAERKISEIGYDTYGSPIETESSAMQPLKEFVPDGVLGRLNDLLKLDGQKTSILDLKAARTDVNNAIKRSQALGSVKDHYLGEIATALDSALKEGAAQPGMEEVKNLFDTATSTYRKGVGKFKDKLLAPLWAHPEEMAVDNGRFYTTLENSSARYNAMKNFFGDGSEAVNGFQDTVKKKLFSDSLASGGSTVDPLKLVKNVEALAQSNPALYKDVVRDQFDNLTGASRLFESLKGGIDIGELSDLVASGAPITRAQVQRLADLEATRAELYNNSVVKKFIKSPETAPPIDPENFVRYLSSANVKDATQVMNGLSSRPDVVDGIRRKTLQTIFQKAARNPSSEDILSQQKGDPTFLVSLQGLQKVLATDDQKAVYKAILGLDKFNELEQYVNLQMLPAQKADRARQVGMLVAGSSTGEAIRGLMNPLNPKTTATLSQWAKIKLLSVFMSHDWGIDAINALQSKVPPPIIGRKLSDPVTAAIISSEPFVKALGEEFKDPLVRFQVASYLKRMTGMSTGEETDNPTVDEFRKGLNPPPKP